MKSWRYAVIEELGETCVCGCGRRAWEVHHLISRSVLRYKFETMNGVPVARGCHGRPMKILEAVKDRLPRRYEWYIEHNNEIETGCEQRLAGHGKPPKKVLSGLEETTDTGCPILEARWRDLWNKINKYWKLMGRFSKGVG